MKKLLYSIVSVILATMLSVSAFAAVPGDVTGDGEVSIVDAMLIVNAVINHETLDGADVNEDGTVNLLDAIRAIKLCAASVNQNTDKATATVVGADGKVAEEVTIVGNTVTADVPVDVALEDNVTELTLSMTALKVSQSGISPEEGESAIAVDVHVEGVASDNTVPIIVTISDWCEGGYNKGNLAVYHVEKNGTVEMTEVDSLDALTEHNTYYYNAEDGTLTIAVATFSEFTFVAKADKAWEGNIDYSWFTAGATSYTIANADELAGFARIVGGMAKDENGNYIYTNPEDPEDHSYSFAGKTVKLVNDVNLADAEATNDPNLLFYPIGYYNSKETFNRADIDANGVTSGFYSFEGTFDGMGHIIANFYQNTWEMIGDHNWYSAGEAYYRDGMGLFGKVYGGTVKNITVKNFSSDGEIATTGTIAAYADFGATFENIAIVNCNPRVYNIGNGGIVGCVGWYTKGVTDKVVTFKNITVDNTNKISALWGSWDVACGGIVGQYYPTSGQSSANYPANPGIHFENCHVAAQIDVYNDVCANYQYYAYRYAGILMGSVRENETINGHSYPKMDGITANDCTVHFGDWNDYYYCELVANSLASYTHDHQMSRLVQVLSVDAAKMKVTLLNGDETDIPTSGRVNYVVVKAKDAKGMWKHGDGHDYAECYHFVDGAVWTHDMAGTETVNGVEGVLKEDKQLVYREFNNLITGYGWGVTSKGVEDMEGVTILDREVADSEIKFATKFENCDTYLYRVGNVNAVSLGTLFEAVEGISISDSGVYVTIDRYDENDTVSGTYTADTADWRNGTIKFEGTGVVIITIQDYDYCTPTEIFVEIVNATNITNANVATATGIANVAVLEDIEGDCNVEYTGNVYGNNFDYSIGTVSIGGAIVDDFVISE